MPSDTNKTTMTNSSDMIDHVSKALAKAICLSGCGDDRCVCSGTAETLECNGAGNLPDIAREVIQAIIPITPSDEMVAAAQAVYVVAWEYGISDDDMRAALTAALNLLGSGK